MSIVFCISYIWKQPLKVVPWQSCFCKWGKMLKTDINERENHNCLNHNNVKLLHQQDYRDTQNYPQICFKKRFDQVCWFAETILIFLPYNFYQNLLKCQIFHHYPITSCLQKITCIKLSNFNQVFKLLKLIFVDFAANAI